MVTASATRGAAQLKNAGATILARVGVPPAFTSTRWTIGPAPSFDDPDSRAGAPDRGLGQRGFRRRGIEASLSGSGSA